MKGGAVIHATEKSEDMYASIDLASHKIAQSLKRHNDKLSGKKNLSIGKLILEADEELEVALADASDAAVAASIDSDESDLDIAAAPSPPQLDIDMSLVRSKEFAMPAISVEEAVVCLSFTDHPFYVFRNKVLYTTARLHRDSFSITRLISTMAGF
jgi:putative sigma-54 modulation protein